MENATPSLRARRDVDRRSFEPARFCDVSPRRHQDMARASQPHQYVKSVEVRAEGVALIYGCGCALVLLTGR